MHSPDPNTASPSIEFEAIDADETVTPGFGANNCRWELEVEESVVLLQLSFGAPMIVNYS